ncbi:MAG TPA: polymer-forming cytoskeletal protein [Labilithrix sp.]|nr:polymer-forming cytoskeletal protein [Labilithrix sp.]
MANPSTTATTLIGSGTFVRGRVTGTGDLEIAGRIEGEVTCSGEVVVESSGLVAASIAARRIVVRGAVKGDLTAEDAVILEAGARVVGDLRAPRIAIAPGGLVRGHVQTGGAGAARPRAAAATASRATTSSASAARPAPVAAAKPAPVAARVERVEPKKADVVVERSNGRPAPRAGTRVGPPPPVVPALKKGTKAVAHHKKR